MSRVGMDQHATDLGMQRRGDPPVLVGRALQRGASLPVAALLLGRVDAFWPR